MLWLALHFPSLALDALARGAREPGPLAVVSSPGANAAVIACNPAARSRGVRVGLAPAAACALDSSLKILARDAAAEQAALERIAAWAMQYTPTVSVAAPSGVLLEIAGSLKLFGGLSRLCGLIENGVSALGYGACIACAPTPLAAQWCARAGFAVKARHHDALRHVLKQLPAAVLDQPPRTAALLEDVGARTVGDFLQLPRDGAARRFGQRLLDDLDRALGRLPDPRAPYTPPPRFAAALPLPAPVHETEALLFAARRLIAELCGFLAARGSGVQRLCLAFSHDGRADTRIALDLVAASRDSGHLLNVLRERLARVGLPAPATAIALAGELLAPLPFGNLSFLPAPGEHAETIARLVERLRARLGDAAISGLDLVADHRPERAWRACEPGRGHAADGPAPRGARPLWLLALPRPLEERNNTPCRDGPLTLLAGPERIESGWWDGGDIVRDYFIACDSARSLLWIYRERRESGGWYLHGFYG